eukprot:2390087-Pleurochrysis_carterae.AAC.1
MTRAVWPDAARLYQALKPGCIIKTLRPTSAPLLWGAPLPNGGPPNLAAGPVAEVALDAAPSQAAQGQHRLLRALLGHMPAVQAEGRVHLGLHRRHGLDILVHGSPPNNTADGDGRGIWSLRAPCPAHARRCQACQMRLRALSCGLNRLAYVKDET